MENKIKEKNFSPNKINIPLSNNESGILDEYIKTNDQNCLDIFTCSICDCLAWDPICCPQCDKIFCRACRLKYGENKICPFKCKSYTFREITRNEKNYLNKINIRCTNVDCSKYIPYLDYKNHLEKCDFRKYHCKNDPCKKEGFLIDMTSHSQICRYRRIICFKCNQKIKYHEKDMHDKRECPEIIVQCEKCKLEMKKGIYLIEHASENNDNPNCLKRQLLNLTKLYNEDMNKNKNEINGLKDKVKELEEKNKKYQNENNILKNNLNEIKGFIKNGYNKFILEENKEKEKNIENILNINDEIKKKNEIVYLKTDYNKKEENYDIGKQYINTDSNFYPKKYDIDHYNNNNNQPENYMIRYKPPSSRNDPNSAKKEKDLHHMRKIPSVSDLLQNNNYNYRKRLYNNQFKK